MQKPSIVAANIRSIYSLGMNLQFLWWSSLSDSGFSLFLLQGFGGFTKAGQVSKEPRSNSFLIVACKKVGVIWTACDIANLPSLYLPVSIYLVQGRDCLLYSLYPTVQGLDTILCGRNFSFLPPIYTCITMVSLFRFPSSIQGERIADNLCIDDSYLHNLPFYARRHQITLISASHYRRPDLRPLAPFYPPVHHYRFCQSSLEVKRVAAVCLL